MKLCTFHTVKNLFIAADSWSVSEDEVNRLVGVWAFNGWELERKFFRSREDDGDVTVVIAREDGAVKCIAEIAKPGAKELGLDQMSLQDAITAFRHLV